MSQQHLLLGQTICWWLATGCLVAVLVMYAMLLGQSWALKNKIKERQRHLPKVYGKAKCYTPESINS